MESGLVKVAAPQTAQRLDEFTVIGDPGCDGLGAATMSVLARALTCHPGQCCIIAGDIVPCGIKPLYGHVRDFIRMAAITPVYTLCGNHDTEFFDEYFGRREYVIADERLLVLVLDNSRRVFSPETLAFCAESLERNRQRNVMLMFHIPPPNRKTDNSIAAAEWEKMRPLLAAHRQRIKYVVCGHVHSYIEDEIDGIPLIITGGGGARIEPVGSDEACHVGHHVIRFGFDPDGVLRHSFESLDGCQYDRETQDSKLAAFLDNAWRNECQAHLRYRIFADDASEQGQPGLAHLFRALSESEYYHARNHYCALGKRQPMEDNLRDSVAAENFEVNSLYKEYADYAVSAGLPLAQYSFSNAREAEKVHNGLLRQALAACENGKDLEDGQFFTCTSCGYTFKMNQAPTRCPICGAPADKIMPAL